MDDLDEVAGEKKNRIDNYEGEKNNQKKTFVGGSKRFAIQAGSAGKMPDKLIHAEKMKYVLGRKGQSKTNRTEVKPSPCACVRSRLLSPAVEVTCQKSKECERRFFFRKPIQRHRQRCDGPEEAGRKRTNNTHHLPTKEIK